MEKRLCQRPFQKQLQRFSLCVATGERAVRSCTGSRVARQQDALQVPGCGGPGSAQQLHPMLTVKQAHGVHVQVVSEPQSEMGECSDCVAITIS